MAVECRPRPFVQGPQTAVVVGPAGEEIYTDKYGRVKVQFHWDRDGKKDENSSCWIRVSQPWAGKNWGGIDIPRIGQEVIVDFLEGDPDQPIITGRVYNAEQMPPYDAAREQDPERDQVAEQPQGGGTANFNEIRFEDKKGSEQVFIHAERNQDIEVENDETHWVGHDRTKTIDHDETDARQARPDRDRREQRDDHRRTRGTAPSLSAWATSSTKIKMGNQTTEDRPGQERDRGDAVDRAQGRPEQHQARPDGRDHQGHDDQDRGPGHRRRSRR